MLVKEQISGSIAVQVTAGLRQRDRHVPSRLHGLKTGQLVFFNSWLYIVQVEESSHKAVGGLLGLCGFEASCF